LEIKALRGDPEDPTKPAGFASKAQRPKWVESVHQTDPMARERAFPKVLQDPSGMKSQPANASVADPKIVIKMRLLAIGLVVLCRSTTPS
jgi:hypothetical protein